LIFSHPHDNGNTATEGLNLSVLHFSYPISYTSSRDS